MVLALMVIDDDDENDDNDGKNIITMIAIC